MSAQPELLPPGTLIGGKYKLIKELGIGGMGAVYRAENLQVGKHVAIKVLHSSVAFNDNAATRFKLEARAAAKIGHPGIVDILDMDTSENGAQYMVMELLQGQPLTKILKAKGRLQPAEVARIGASLLDALSAAHNAGIVHRDIKPGNIWICDEPALSVKILDFGISKFEETSDLSLTQAGVLIGTPNYMAPEQFEMAEVGSPIDIYAVGVVLYQALAGRRPFRAKTLQQLRITVITGKHEALSDEIHPKLSSIISQMMARDSEKRPSAAEAKSLLEELVEGNAPLLTNKETSWPSLELAQTGGTAQGKSVERKPAGVTASNTAVNLSQRVGNPVPEEQATPSAGNKILLPLLGGIAVLAAVGAVVFALANSSETNTKVETKSAAIVEAKEVESVGVHLAATPTNAVWSINGKKQDCNPCDLVRTKGETLTAIASAPGHKPATFQFSADEPLQERRVVLEPNLVVPANPEREGSEKNDAQDAGSLYTGSQTDVADEELAKKKKKSRKGKRRSGKKKRTGLDIDEKNPFR